jgi:Predicted membrane protein
MNQTRGDALVADYLERVWEAAAGLDPVRREELIQDLREHIAAARAELSPETEAGVQTILDRLGDPAVIAAEAAVGEAPSWSAPVADRDSSAQPTGGESAGRSRNSAVKALIVVLVVLLLVPVVVCLVGALGFLAFRTEEPVENHGPVVEIPVPTEHSSASPTS